MYTSSTPGLPALFARRRDGLRIEHMNAKNLNPGGLQRGVDGGGGDFAHLIDEHRRRLRTGGAFDPAAELAAAQPGFEKTHGPNLRRDPK